MSMQPQAICPIPEETARVAHLAYSKGNVSMRLRDVLGTIYEDEIFTSVFPQCGQPAEAPWRLALVSVMQFMEGLSDRQAADAVRGRIDWKYTLGLELTDPGFDHTVLSEFRTRLVTGKIEHLLFDTLLSQLRERGYLKPRGQQRTDSTHVLAAVRALNRLECVGETFRHALNCLAIVAPDWLRERIHPDWVERYDHRVDDYRLPKGETERQAYALVIGTDGVWLLNAIFSPDAPAWLCEIPAVDILRRVWIQNFLCIDQRLAWRSNDQIPPALQFIGSPYDVEAHYSKKRSTSWVGYKVHFTETCDEETPHLIAHVETTSAPITDASTTACIHEHLKEKDLLPSLHVVDTGYVDADLLVSSQKDFQIELFGPTRDDCQWQAHEGQGCDAQHFVIDWQQQIAVCPEGHSSSNWTPTMDTRGHEIIRIKSSRDATVGAVPAVSIVPAQHPPIRGA